MKNISIALAFLAVLASCKNQPASSQDRLKLQLAQLGRSIGECADVDIRLQNADSSAVRLGGKPVLLVVGPSGATCAGVKDLPGWKEDSIGPSQSISLTVDINVYFKLEGPGTYRVSASYGDLKTDSVEMKFTE